MLIQCTSCGAQARIPDSKQGAKVRCPSCEHVFVARAPGASRARAGSDPTKYFIYGGAAIVALFVALIATRGEDEPSYAAPEAEDTGEPEETAFVDPLGWNGPVVALARQMHAAAFSANESKLLSKFDAPTAYELEGAALAVAATEEAALEGDASADDGEGAAADEADPSEARPPWDELGEVDRIRWADATIARALVAGDGGAVAGWEPFDGAVKSIENGVAVVDLRVQARDTSLGLDDRWTRWTLRNLDGDGGAEDRWRWSRVERFITPEELAAMRRKNRKKTVQKTLSDGSIVIEGDVRPIPFDPEVSTEDRERLTALTEQLVADLDAPPRERNAVIRELVETGKPAIPALLTKIYEITEQMPEDLTDSPDDLNRIFFLHNVMREITGVETTFDVSVEMGATKERILSGVKQWYGWYDKQYKKFEGRELGGDPLADDPDFQPKTPEEIRAYNKALKEELEQERRKNQDG